MIAYLSSRCRYHAVVMFMHALFNTITTIATHVLVAIHTPGRRHAICTKMNGTRHASHASMGLLAMKILTGFTEVVLLGIAIETDPFMTAPAIYLFKTHSGTAPAYFGIAVFNIDNMMSAVAAESFGARRTKNKIFGRMLVA